MLWLPSAKACGYKRNGTTTLFAALNMLDGTVIGECMPRHRHREFLRFLNTIDEWTPPNLDLHLIVDNYATHKTPAVKRWLKRHSRFHLSLNMVERFFAETTRKRVRRGVFKSVDELKQAIIDYLDKHNDQLAGTGSRSPAPASRACSPSTSHPSVQTSPTSAPRLLRSGLAQATQRWLAAFKSKKGGCR